MFNDLQAADWTVCGIALLRSPGVQLTDTLALGSETLRALHQSWGSPVLDAKCKLHLFDIVDFAILEPVPAQTVKQKHEVRSDVLEMDFDFVQGLLSCDVKSFCAVSNCTRAVGRLDAVVRSWIEKYQIPTASMRNLAQLLMWGIRSLPAVTKLMSTSGLRSIMLQPRESLDDIASGVIARRLHQSMFGGGVLGGRRVDRKTKKSVDDGSAASAEWDMLAPERFRSLSDFLCLVAPAIKEKHPGLDAELHDHLDWAQHMQKKFSKSNELIAAVHGGRHMKKYKMSALIQSLRISMECIGDSRIPAIVSSTLDLVCDRDIANFYKDLLTDPDNALMKIPSPSTLSRKRMMLDCGFMLLMRVLNSAKASRFGMSDSSPQLRKDWYIQLQCTIKDKDLVSVLRATHTLALTKHLFGDKSRKELTEFLHMAIDTHTCVPATLAWRRASLLHKLECMVQSFLMEVSGEIAGVEKHLGTFYSWTTDQGVESLQADVEWVRVGDLLEWLPGGASKRSSTIQQHSLDELDLPEDDSQPPPILIESREEQFARQHLMPNTLWVPGILHILHKATETLLDALESWKDCVKEQVNALIKFLSKSYCRDAFVSVCLLQKGDDASQFSQLYATFAPRVADWRWGSLLVALCHIIPLQYSLVRYWNHNAMAKDFGRSKKDTEEDGEFLPGVTKAITSDFLWAYVAMMLLLGEVLVSMTALAESCVCHSSPDLSTFGTDLASKSKHYRRRKAKQQDSGKEICPNSGKRAPEFAAGRAIEYLHHLMSLCEGKVLEHASRLNTSERSKLLRDFNRGRSHLVMFITSKLRFWQQLPYILCGLAHHDSKAAVAAASRALALFQATSEGTRHHRVTWFFLEPGSLMRQALVEFIAGKQLGESPWSFQLAVARLAQVFIAERLMEAQHKNMGQAARHACRTSEAYASICLRGSELVRRMDQNSDVLFQLETLCYSVRTPRKIVETLDLSLHPGIAEELRKNGKLRHRAVCKVVYHSDLVRCHRSLKGLAEEILQRAGQYYSTAAAAAAAANLSNVKQEEELQQPEDAQQPQLADEKVQASDIEIYQKLVYKGAQSHLKEETLQAGGWYSSASVGEQVTSHDARLRLRTQIGSEEQADIECRPPVEFVAHADLDFAELSIPEPLPLVRSKHFVFNLFSPLAMRMDKNKYVPLLSGVQGYEGNDIVVTLHDVVQCKGERIKVPLQPAKLTADTGKGKSLDDTTTCIWHLPSDLAHESLRDVMLKWECTENVEYELKGSMCHVFPFPVNRINELVRKMMDGRCFGQAGQDFVTNRSDEVQVLQALSQKQLCDIRNVAPAYEAVIFGYKLTQQGLDSLVSFNILKSPSYCLHARPVTDAVSLADLTTYELLDHMFLDGWQMRALHHGQRSKSMGVVAYQVGKPKHWWMRASKTNVSWSYLRALLTVDASWPPVTHLCTDVQYDHFVEHKAWPEQKKPKRQAAIKDGLEGIEEQMAKVERTKRRPKASSRRPAKRARALQDSEQLEPLQDIELHCLKDQDVNRRGDDDSDDDDADKTPDHSGDDASDKDSSGDDGGDDASDKDKTPDRSGDDSDKDKSPDCGGDDASDKDSSKHSWLQGKEGGDVVPDESEDNGPLTTLLHLGRRAASPNLESDLRSDNGSDDEGNQTSSSGSTSSSSSSSGSDVPDCPHAARQVAETIVIHGETFVRLRSGGEFQTLEIVCPKCKWNRKCSHRNIEVAEAARRLLLWRGCCPAHMQPNFGGPLLRNLLDDD
jgi:hypothetical protein